MQTLKNILFVSLFPAVPPEERENYWLVDADNPYGLEKKSKKKRKRKKKEVRPLNESKGIEKYNKRASTAVPRLPKLPVKPGLVTRTVKPQEFEEALPGSYREYRRWPPFNEGLYHAENMDDHLGYKQYTHASFISHPFSTDELPIAQHSGVQCIPHPRRDGVFQYSNGNLPSYSTRHGPCNDRTQTRRSEIPPMHSRANLMDAELMDTDSDF